MHYYDDAELGGPSNRIIFTKSGPPIHQVVYLPNLQRVTLIFIVKAFLSGVWKIVVLTHIEKEKYLQSGSTLPNDLVHYTINEER